LSKTQRDTGNKAKMIGKIVVDQEGNLVGTVKDVGFEGGNSGITLSVEDKDGQFQDISWESIQGAADFVVLKPPQQVSSPQVVQQVQPATQNVQSAQVVQPTQQQHAQSTQPLCPICRSPLTWIPQYKRWYCYKDQKYA
jgi:sporulation protein YlmC with PRC-barrel domain